jgi:biotin carboxyl carrier protein
VAEIVLRAGDRQIETRVTAQGGDTAVQIGGRELRFHLEPLGPTTWRLIDQDGAAHIMRAIEAGDVWWLHLDGETVAVSPAAPGRPPGSRSAGRREGLEAPMPGAVTLVAVREGDTVAAGQPLVMIEAMKIEHVIRAPHAGRVAVLRVRPGEQVDAGTVVAELEPGGAPAQPPMEPAP